MFMRYVVPKAGTFLRDPRTRKPIPTEGIDVVLTTFWNRRLRDGSIFMYDNKLAAEAAKE